MPDSKNSPPASTGPKARSGARQEIPGADLAEAVQKTSARGRTPFLLFSDIPPNRIMRWSAPSNEAIVFMHPAGYTGAKARGGEPGTNGLTLDKAGRLVACDHGDRRVYRLESDGTKKTLADKFEGKRLNSPNDLCYKSNGDLYFTDPPYGLEKNWDDPARELDFCGVYRLTADGKLTLLTKELTRPNGVAFSPDEKTLYVAQSDPAAAIWRAFDVKDDGTITNSRVLFDATDWVKAGRKGLPDGLKVDKDGNLWATGPGGVVVLDKTENTSARSTPAKPPPTAAGATTAPRFTSPPTCTWAAFAPAPKAPAGDTPAVPGNSTTEGHPCAYTICPPGFGRR